MTHVSNVDDALTKEDLWFLMRRRVPPIVSEYFRGGVDDEITLKGNLKAFQQTVLSACGAPMSPT